VFHDSDTAKTEIFVRRELADNFCFYNPKYDSIDGAADWAKETLKLHEKDKRQYVYSLEQFERVKHKKKKEKKRKTKERKKERKKERRQR
jgi:hypothetical protein